MQTKVNAQTLYSIVSSVTLDKDWLQDWREVRLVIRATGNKCQVISRQGVNRRLEFHESDEWAWLVENLVWLWPKPLILISISMALAVTFDKFYLCLKNSLYLLKGETRHQNQLRTTAYLSPRAWWTQWSCWVTSWCHSGQSGRNGFSGREKCMGRVWESRLDSTRLLPLSVCDVISHTASHGSALRNNVSMRRRR